ncbi:hypothetical protein Tco_0484729 [Tanacetum coccineum]
MALLSMRARKFYQRTGRKIIIDGSSFKASTYKRGLSILEGQILKYKESEVLFSEEIALLKRSVGHKEYLMGLLRTELEKVKEEKEGFEFKIAKFEKSSKDLDQLLASQITDKSKKGFGYNVVPSPHPLILNRPTSLDLSYSGLEEFKQPEVNEYGPRDSSVKPTTGCDKESDNSKENTDDYLKQQQKTDSKTSSLKVDKIGKKFVFEKKTVIPTATKKEFVKPETPVRRSVRARGFNAVKPSACWVWKPTTTNGAITGVIIAKDKGFVDSGYVKDMLETVPIFRFQRLCWGICYFWWGQINDGRINGIRKCCFFYLYRLCSCPVSKLEESSQRSPISYSNVDVVCIELPRRSIEELDEKRVGARCVSFIRYRIKCQAEFDIEKEKRKLEDENGVSSILGDQEIELGNHSSSYDVPTTPPTRFTTELPLWVDDLLFVLRDLCDTGKEFDVTVIERGIVSVGERNSIAGVLNGDIVCLRVTILRLPTDNSELMQKIGLILYVFKCRKEELKLLLFYSNRLELDNCVLVVRRGASGRMRLQSVSSRRDVRGRSDTSD